MKTILMLAITCFARTTSAQTINEPMGQQMTPETWEEEAKTDIRLLPKYGHVRKTEDQKQADQEFIETILKQDGTRRKGSDHLISLGFRYLYKDIKTAMYRFNQAYLLDSTNIDIYWGFGGVYMTLGNYEKAKQQYEEGLAIQPNNPHLLIDYGTYFMIQYNALQPVDKKNATTQLDLAIRYLSKSQQLAPTDQNTALKLSVCYWNKGDCERAWTYYELCKSLGGQPITDEYTAALRKKCGGKK